MAALSSSGKPPVTRGHCYLLLAASLMTCTLVTMGGIVCATESAAGCPDWPGCFGRIVPPPQVNAIIEYLHRFIAALTSPLIIAAAVVSWRKAREIRCVSRPAAVAIPFTLAVIIFGAFAVLTGLPPAIAAIDLGSALTVLALMVTATVAAFARRADPDLPDRLGGGGFARLSLATVGAAFVVQVSGILTAGKGSLTRCLGWPMWRVLPDDVPGWPQVARLALAGVTALLIVAVVVQAWRTQRGQGDLLRLANLLGLVFVIQIAAGLLMLAGQESLVLSVIYVASAAVLWALLVAVAVLAAFSAASEEQRVSAPEPTARQDRRRPALS